MLNTYMLNVCVRVQQQSMLNTFKTVYTFMYITSEFAQETEHTILCTFSQGQTEIMLSVVISFLYVENLGDPEGLLLMLLACRKPKNKNYISSYFD